MNEPSKTQEQRLTDLFGQWPCTKNQIADGKEWEIYEVDKAPDMVEVGSTIRFDNCTVKPTINATFCSTDPEILGQIKTAWGEIDLKYCTEYNALTGKLDIAESCGHAHAHTITVRISAAESLKRNKPVIVCVYDDDVWNHSGHWKAQH